MTTTIDAPPIPPAIESHQGGGDDWVELARAGNDIEAHLFIGRLREAGVETRTLKDRSAPGAWLYGGSNPWAPVVILVHRLQFVDARIVMAEISLDGPAVSGVAGSPRSEMRRRSLAWWAAAIALGVIFTSVALVRTGSALGSCGIPIVCGGEGPGSIR